MSIRIGILGTRGIPNHYGGFERLAEKLSVGLVNSGHEVVVYNSHNHPCQLKEWEGVQIRHCYDPEYLMGSFGQFIYDFNCILDARKMQFDVILFLGYTSSSVWGWLFPVNSVIICNMDGMEWKRSKYSKIVQRFLRYAEKLAVKSSDFLISDSPLIQSYLSNKYKVESEYIAYGASLISDYKEEVLIKYGISRYEYLLTIARIEPENNIELILDGFAASTVDKQFLVVGNHRNAFGKYLMNKFRQDTRIRFAGPVYDEQEAHALRLFSHCYFHGHSTGGTNPSLLEAMAGEAAIIAHDNVYNKAVLQEDARYFSSVQDVQRIIEEAAQYERKGPMISNNLQKIRDNYNWPLISSQYEKFMLDCLFIHSNWEKLYL